MSEYDGSTRKLPYPLKNVLVYSQTTEDDGDCEPSSFVWPEDPDERIAVSWSLSLNEYNVLSSTIDVGSDIAYGEDAIRVMWLWLRNMRCEVDMPCCDDILNAISDLDNRIGAQIISEGNQLALAREAYSQAEHRYLESIYDGTPHSINEHLLTGSHNWTDADYSREVLCSALRGFLYAWAKAKADEVVASYSINRVWQQAAAYLLLNGLGFFAPYAVALYTYYGFLNARDAQTMVAALTDTEALDQIACAMETNMQGNAINSGNWVNALIYAPFPTFSHAGLVREILLPTMEENYLPFLGFFGVAYYEWSTNGVTAVECACGEQNCFQNVINGGTVSPYTQYGTILSQNFEYMIFEAQEFDFSGTTAYGVQQGDSSQSIGCTYAGYEIVDGTFTASGGTPEGFVAYKLLSGVTYDIDEVDYGVSLLSFQSSTPFTIKLFLS